MNSRSKSLTSFMVVYFKEAHINIFMKTEMFRDFSYLLCSTDNEHRG